MTLLHCGIAGHDAGGDRFSDAGAPAQTAGAAAGAALRPDDAYIEKAAKPRSKFVLFAILLLCMGAISLFFGMMLAGLLMIVFY